MLGKTAAANFARAEPTFGADATHGFGRVESWREWPACGQRRVGSCGMRWRDWRRTTPVGSAPMARSRSRSSRGLCATDLPRRFPHELVDQRRAAVHVERDQVGRLHVEEKGVRALRRRSLRSPSSFVTSARDERADRREGLSVEVRQPAVKPTRRALLRADLLRPAS
jgi:hypothetical protein